jgi:glycine C-acetyltransferase
MLGDAQLAQKMSARLDELGIYVAGFFFPVVPKGQARIRTQMNAALSKDDLDKAADAFEQAGRETGAI